MTFKDWFKEIYVKRGFVSSEKELAEAFEAGAAAERLPLATLRNMQGNDADMTPAQMRALAAALEAAASECELRPMDRKHFSRTLKRYPLTLAPRGLPAAAHSAKECSEAFEWLRAEATKDGASKHAGVALDEWHALTMTKTPNAK